MAPSISVHTPGPLTKTPCDRNEAQPYDKIDEVRAETLLTGIGNPNHA